MMAISTLGSFSIMISLRQSQARCRAFLISEEKEATLQDRYKSALLSKSGES
jgi:hypothetical protein